MRYLNYLSVKKSGIGLQIFYKKENEENHLGWHRRGAFTTVWLWTRGLFDQPQVSHLVQLTVRQKTENLANIKLLK
jgi:hypothetical protein